MFLNLTTKYALRALIEMSQDSEKLHSANALHKSLHIPEKYLKKLLTDLAKHGFVKSARGRSGGFHLAIDPEKVYLSDVINAVESMELYNQCFFGIKECNYGTNGKCAVHDSWIQARDEVSKLLTTTSLADFLNKEVCAK